MPPRSLKHVQGKRFPPDDPREWLNRAKSNLAQARARIENVYLEEICALMPNRQRRRLSRVYCCGRWWCLGVSLGRSRRAGMPVRYADWCGEEHAGCPGHHHSGESG